MVVIFFVFSGFVTSYFVSRGRNYWKTYLVARFSRIASVANPAIVVAIICDLIGRRIAAELYSEIARMAFLDAHSTQLSVRAVVRVSSSQTRK